MLRKPNSADRIDVTDETGGALIDCRSAFFVRSSAATNPITGNRIHAFRNRADAENHARAFHGEELRGSERPFSAEGPDP
jgi:hypothetical protein